VSLNLAHPVYAFTYLSCTVCQLNTVGLLGLNTRIMCLFFCSVTLTIDEQA